MIWQELGTLPIDPEWRFSANTVSEWFRVEQINPPYNGNFLLCQSDGAIIHKPLTLSSGREAEMIQMPLPAPFSAGRKIGVRLENTNFQIKNWSIKISTLIPSNAVIRYWLEGTYYDGVSVKVRSTEPAPGHYYDFAASYGLLSIERAALIATVADAQFYKYRLRLDANNAYDFTHSWVETPVIKYRAL